MELLDNVSGAAATQGTVNNRRAPRIGFQLPVRCRHGALRSTIMLKDLTTDGARVEGLTGLQRDEPITLLLPGLQPKEAYVTWSTTHSAGVEFDCPLQPSIFAKLVEDFAIHRNEGQERADHYSAVAA